MLLESPDTGQKERSIRIEKEVDWSPQGGGVHSADVFRQAGYQPQPLRPNRERREKPVVEAEPENQGRAQLRVRRYFF